MKQAATTGVPKQINAIVAAGIIFGAVAFLIVCLALTPQPWNWTWDVLAIAGFAIATATIVAAFIIPGLIEIPVANEPGSQSERGSERAAASPTQSATGQGALNPRMLVRLALLEAGVFANLAFFLTMSSAVALIPAGLGIAVMICCFPLSSLLGTAD